MKTSPKTTTWWYSGGSNKAIDLVYYKYLIGIDLGENEKIHS